LCGLHRRLGVPDTERVIRPIVRRGRAVDHGLDVDVGPDELLAALLRLVQDRPPGSDTLLNIM
jgi:hypothetical protein